MQVCKVSGQDNPADLMTKHLAADVMLKHSWTLCLEFLDGRAELAPTLSGDSRGNRPSDDWSHAGLYVVRRHDRLRRELFTPSTVDGHPPIKMLTSTRITEGSFVDSGGPFCVVDNWKDLKDAHRNLGKAWVGTTRFVLRADLRV